MTDVLGGGKFYVQTEEARVTAIQKTLEGLRLKDKPMVQGMFVPQKGDTVIAQFSSDNSWNRALVSGYMASQNVVDDGVDVNWSGLVYKSSELLGF